MKRWLQNTGGRSQLDCSLGHKRHDLSTKSIPLEGSRGIAQQVNLNHRQRERGESEEKGTRQPIFNPYTTHGFAPPPHQINQWRNRPLPILGREGHGYCLGKAFFDDGRRIPVNPAFTCQEGKEEDWGLEPRAFLAEAEPKTMTTAQTKTTFDDSRRDIRRRTSTPPEERFVRWMSENQPSPS